MLTPHEPAPVAREKVQLGAGAASLIGKLREVPRYKICNEAGQAPHTAAKRRNGGRCFARWCERFRPAGQERQHYLAKPPIWRCHSFNQQNSGKSKVENPKQGDGSTDPAPAHRKVVRLPRSILASFLHGMCMRLRQKQSCRDTQSCCTAPLHNHVITHCIAPPTGDRLTLPASATAVVTLENARRTNGSKFQFSRDMAPQIGLYGMPRAPKNAPAEMNNNACVSREISPHDFEE